MINVLVNGATGKLGQVAVQAIDADPELECVGELGRYDCLSDAMTTTGCDVVFDATTADVAYDNTKLIIERGKHPVVGTSGLLPEQLAALQAQCQEQDLGGIVVPNFSISAVLMIHFSELAAQWLPQAEIVEIHHQAKKDAPSGTAVKTAEQLRKAGVKHAYAGKELMTGALGANATQVPIHSMRLPGYYAEQTVYLAGPGETLSITAKTQDRQAFAAGIQLACKRVVDLDHLAYGLEQFLFL